MTLKHNNFIFPNIFWVFFLLGFAALSLFAAMSFFFAFAFAINLGFFPERTVMSGKLNFYELGSVIVLIYIFLRIGFAILFIMRLRWCHIWFTNKQMIIVRPLTFTFKRYSYSDIMGYSESEVVAIDQDEAAESGIELIGNKKFIVMYMNDCKIYELVKIYNLGFRSIKSQLKGHGCKFFGFEEYNQYDNFLATRKYKFSS